ncbi:hypothetical protein, partial [Mesorhizobium sp. M7A.F.Ca.CA.001.16.1.1]|uniref:hypothetical protein n=1 Tax=Mesorhizobium sp. M7A.F.Ca.CA.001.16.1.1 TaxID=2496683 RepID=UPI0019D4A755
SIPSFAGIFRGIRGRQGVTKLSGDELQLALLASWATLTLRATMIEFSMPQLPAALRRGFR